MSQKGSGLARLMGGLRSLDSDADTLAGRLEAALANLTAEMATTTKIVGNVEASVGDLRAVHALYSNGAPSPMPGSSGALQAQSRSRLIARFSLHSNGTPDPARAGGYSREPHSRTG